MTISTIAPLERTFRFRKRRCASFMLAIMPTVFQKANLVISTHHPLGRLKNPEGSFPPFPHGTSPENSSTIGTHTFLYSDRPGANSLEDTQRSPRPSGGGDLAFSEDSREIPCHEQPRHFFPSVRNPASHPRMHGPFHYDRAIMRRQMFTGKPGILLLCRHCQGTDNPSHRL